MDLPSNYTGGLAQSAARKQSELIQKSREEYKKTGKVFDRPKVSDAKTPRSSHAVKFENKMGYKISELGRVRRDFPDTDVDMILKKGRAAYGSSGSRPNTSVEGWARARLASVLTGGKALAVDKSSVGPTSMAKIRE